MPAAKKKAPAKAVRAPAQRIHKPDVSKALLEDLIDGLHILAGHKVLDAYGHLSARSDRNPDHFVMTRSRSPAIAEIDTLASALSRIVMNEPSDSAIVPKIR